MNLIAALPYLNPVYVHQPVAFILHKFLKRHKIAISRELLSEKLAKHPFHPSLLSVSDVLDDLGLAHQAARIDFSLLMERKEIPALIHLSIGEGAFGVILNLNEDAIKVLMEQGEERTFSKEQFLNAWNGIFLTLEANVTPVATISETRAPRWVVHAFTALAAFFIFYWLFKVPLPGQIAKWGSVLLNCGALMISWLLVLQHLNRNNRFVQGLCNSKTNKGCKSVLEAGSSKITNWLTMADVGLMYFAATTLLSLFFPTSVLYYYLAVLAPLFSLYAIYLQAFVIKEWCRLCNIVHGLVLLSFIITVATTELPNIIPLILFKEVTLFIIPTLIWGVMKPLLIKLREANFHRSQYAGIKFDPEIFSMLIQKQGRVIIPDDIKIFTLGNLQAQHELVFVSNPFCDPCARAHATIEEWLKREIDFKVICIFLHTSNVNDKNREFVERLGGLDTAHLAKALHDWFSSNENRNIDRWAKRLRLKPEVLPYDESRFIDWQNQADIQGTPTFFINGYKLPEGYSLKDIKYLITGVPVHSGPSSPLIAVP